MTAEHDDLDELMEEFDAADGVVRAITQRVVARHRAAGVLTWALLHQIESEVLEEAARDGRCSLAALNMMRAPAAMTYPRDDRPASFAGHGLVPIVFGAAMEAWSRFH